MTHIIEGHVKNWSEDTNIYFSHIRSKGKTGAHRAQAEFRKNFSAPLFEAKDENSATLTTLPWGTKITLPEGLSNGKFTKAQYNGQTGYFRTRDICEIAWVGSSTPTVSSIKKPFKLTFNSGAKADLIWGDMVQIFDVDEDEVRVRSRGLTGRMKRSDLQGEALLDVYFIDVGQGDGALIRMPDGVHIMIDGGQARSRQMTGKNAADLVDWKFFVDYGDWKIDLDWMIASHSDADHYGGLQDLISDKPENKAGLDCLDVNVKTFGHPGLSRFPKSVHNDKLGPLKDKKFTALMTDRQSAEKYVDGSGPDGLKFSRNWRAFMVDILKNPTTNFSLLALDQADASQANLPNISTSHDYDIFVLGPVTEDVNGAPALRDLGVTGKNTNGHSVCLRLDYGNSRIMMTGDLNGKSMDWLASAFGPHMGEWESDVAKACHHGSSDVRFSFLDAINAGATIISSGDNEGHAHPTPQIVSASALSGRRRLSDDGEDVITPLVYMTEIERSVLLSEVNRLEVDEADHRETYFAKPISEFSDSEFLSSDDWNAIKKIERNNHLSEEEKKSQVKEIKDLAKSEKKSEYLAREEELKNRNIKSTLYGNRPTGAVGSAQTRENLHRLRMLERNRYGMVTVRTDGKLILCATKRDDGNLWNLNSFEAEAGANRSDS